MNWRMTGVWVLVMTAFGLAQTRPATTAGSATSYAERLVVLPPLPQLPDTASFHPEQADITKAWIAQAVGAVLEGRRERQPPNVTADPESRFLGLPDADPVWRLTLGDPAQQARETMDAIVAELRRTWDAKRQEIEQVAKKAREEKAELERKVKESSGRMALLTMKRDAEAPTYGDPQVARPALVKANEELETLETDLAGMKARREAIIKNLEDLSLLVHKKVLDDAVSKELKVVLDLRTQALQRKKDLVDKGVAGTSDVEAAEAAVAEAKARLLERQEQVAGREGGETLSAWNRELANLGIDTADKAARVEYLKNRAAAMSFALEAADKLPKLEEQLKDLESQLAAAKSRQEGLEAAAAKAEKARVEVKSEENR